MVKHCCHGFCSSDSRNVDRREDMQGVFFIRFPKPKVDIDKSARWILACGREDVTFDRLTKDAYICSKHFVGGQGPTDDFPDPLPVSESDVAAQCLITSSTSKRLRKKRVCQPIELAKKMFGEYGEQVLVRKFLN